MRGDERRRKSERIYVGAFEVYREYGPDGAVTLERETLNVFDDKHRLALVETRTAGTDRGPGELIRYQLANHLDSSVLELDQDAQVISYEEYYPYGSTSYQAVARQTEAPKRYRYTGKERDEENGLYYHGARYYSPWLGRWTSCDPNGFVNGVNFYVYVRGRPTAANDPTGRWLNIVIGAIAGFLVGGGVELGRQLIKGEKVDWGRVGAAAVGGAVGGAIAGATFGLGLAAEALGAGVGAAVGGATTRLITGEKQTVGSVAQDFAIGVLTFGLLKGATAGVGAIRSAASRSLAAGGEGGSEAAASRISAILREGGPTGGGKATAAAEVDVPAYEGRSPVLRARSGSGTPDPSLQDVPHSPVPQDPALTTSKVLNAPGEHAGSRATDAEIKILNEVQKGLPPDAKGTVRLGSTKPLCPSCTTAVFEFQGNNPGVKVEVFAPSRPVPTIPTGPPVGAGAPAAGVGSRGSAIFRDQSSPPDQQQEGITIFRW